MLIIDKLLVKGIRFCLDKVIQAADQELNDASALREQLLQAQMRRELREISERQGGGVIDMGARPEGGEGGEDDLKITGVEATFGGDAEGLQALGPKEDAPEE